MKTVSGIENLKIFYYNAASLMPSYLHISTSNIKFEPLCIKFVIWELEPMGVN